MGCWYRQYIMMKWLRIIAILCLFFMACGVKAPPVPRGYVAPETVKDLRHALEDKSVALSWTVPEPENGKGYKVEGAIIYRLKNSLENAECKNCPLLFSEIKNLPVNKRNMIFREPLEQGFRYYYKVAIYDENEIKSGDSNIVRFEYP